MPITFAEYIKKVESDLKHGIATEHTYRGAFENLVESYGRGISASNDPKHQACGAPDFIVEKRKVPLGYIETKDIGADLNFVEKTPQMQRYLKALNNLILTDYLEFRWYLNGQKKLTLRVAEIGRNHRLEVIPGAEDNLAYLFRDFFTILAPVITSPKELAKRLAAVTHFIRDQIIAAIETGDPAVQRGLESRLAAFRELLLPGLTPAQFADLYAQAMTYGLFAAKLSTPPGEPFTLESAYGHLTSTKFLRRLFMDVSEELDEIEVIRPYLQDIVSLLNRADFASILEAFGNRTRTEDPVVHFYETFLAEYDPKLRESRGVYYTPEPVVQFIIRAVDDILKTRFGKPWGLADSSVKILDPAVGTGTFLYFVIQQIHDEVVNIRHQAGQWPQKSKELLGRIFGFELLMAPYVVTHLKLGLLLGELGAPLTGQNERLQVYLTNTLEEGISRAEQFAGLGHYIAEESSDAARVKKRDDIMVILGNPPYSGHSANSSVGPDGKPNFIGRLIRDYYFVDGAPLGERNPKWLQDDYVKFVRFGEWRINQTGYGILAFITNHGYLDNPTFRGMRQHLMQTFDEIYILDLHGNSKKKEVALDGTKDENVFDIQQGVAIILAVKYHNFPTNNLSQRKFWHADLWGSREIKYEILVKTDFTEVNWQLLSPNTPFYLFTPQDEITRREFQVNWRIDQIMPINSAGIVTARDNLTIHFDKDEIWRLVNEFMKLNTEEARVKYSLGSDTRDWKVHLAQQDITESKVQRKYITRISYRPFDNRYTYYTGKVRGFICMPRKDVMKHFQNDNLGLITARSNKSQTQDQFFCTSSVVETKCAESTTQSSIFPLYIYTTSEETAGTLFAQAETTRRPNLSPEFINTLSEKLCLAFVTDGLGDGLTTFGPEDVFNYAYAVFHSPTYRTRYAEFLKIDFPRLPLTSDRALFFALAAKGRELVAYHLLKTPRVDDFITTYPVTGANRVEKVAFTPDPDAVSLEPAGRVYINQSQYFGAVPEAVWNFKIGGYQVCDKWLKDRKGRALTGDDISHYQRVVVALRATIGLMSEIDQLIPQWPIE